MSISQWGPLILSCTSQLETSKLTEWESVNSSVHTSNTQITANTIYHLNYLGLPGEITYSRSGAKKVQDKPETAFCASKEGGVRGKWGHVLTTQEPSPAKAGGTARVH